jgi:outer membrane lipoprotein-sorting protein
VNKKGISTLVIVAIIVIAVVIAGIAIYVWYSGGGEPTPTPTPTPTSPVEGATSMRFDVEATVESGVETDRFTVKNLGTSDILLRVDQTDAQGNNFIYLMNQTGQTAWADFGTGFLDQSEHFTDQYWNNELIGKVALDKYMTALANWSGTGDYEGDTFTISNIVVNPTIDDSVFEPTS